MTVDQPRPLQLVFEPGGAGHHIEYICHLVETAAAEAHPQRLLILVNPGFARIAPHACQIADRHPEAVRIVPLSADEFNAYWGQPGARERAMAQWRIVCHHARIHRASRVTWLWLDSALPALLLPAARRASFSIEGILFGHPQWRHGSPSRALVRELRIAALLTNTRVSRVWILNAPRAVRRLNRLHFWRPIFEWLPDPTAGSTPEDATLSHGAFGIERGRKVLLLCGMITERKGVFEVLRAIPRLDRDVLQHTCLVIAGQVSDPLWPRLGDAISRCRLEAPDAQVVFLNRFLGQAEFEALCRRADLFLLPYQGFTSSSGFLGHAARLGKPVLGPREGLIAELIADYGLGSTVNPRDIRALAARLGQVIRGTFQPPSAAGMARYVAERSPAAFAQRLLRW